MDRRGGEDDRYRGGSGRDRSRGYEDRGRGGRGDRGRGGDRGGYRGGGGGGYDNKQPIISTSLPGQVNLYSNNFKLTIKQTGFVYIYNIDFGAFIDSNDMRRPALDDKRNAINSVKENLGQVFGKYKWVGNNIFALVKIE